MKMLPIVLSKSKKIKVHHVCLRHSLGTRAPARAYEVLKSAAKQGNKHGQGIIRDLLSGTCFKIVYIAEYV